ncbi:hypothetical protein L0337_38650 [candidate division KSB1 bacterium]|nr:hypothetical protein [candidate division KSB1 bacterium]
MIPQRGTTKQEKYLPKKQKFNFKKTKFFVRCGSHAVIRLFQRYQFSGIFNSASEDFVLCWATLAGLRPANARPIARVRSHRPR